MTDNNIDVIRDGVVLSEDYSKLLVPGTVIASRNETFMYTNAGYWVSDQGHMRNPQGLLNYVARPVELIKDVHDTTELKDLPLCTCVVVNGELYFHIQPGVYTGWADKHGYSRSDNEMDKLCREFGYEVVYNPTTGSERE